MDYDEIFNGLGLLAENLRIGLRMYIYV